MMPRKWTLMTVVLVMLMGCAGIQTSQDYDPATDFKTLRTFRWASPSQPKTGDDRIDNPFRDARIRAAIERVLREKGLIYQADQPVDVLVSYRYTLRSRIDTSGTSGGFGFGIGSYGRYGGVSLGTGGDAHEIDEGSLVIDLSAAASNTLLWRGSGTERFQEYDDPEKTTRDINSLVESILNQFPPES